jgi:pimeloyl-ACP methyl ester carboxylesterase
MALNNLTIKIGYPKHGYSLPILLIIHGWDSQTIDDDVVDRMTQQGLFVAAVGMRGRGGADGARDASGREIYDILDAVNYIKANYATRISDKINIWGISGGGGTAMACACKLPDTFSTCISYFGISDYGYNATYGWHQENYLYRTGIEASVGGTPTAVPNNYHSRYAIEGIINYTGGHITLVGDTEDGTVPHNQSTRLKDAMVAAGLSNYTELYSTTTDDVRYLHTMSNNGVAARQAEATWIPLAKNTAAWTIPTSGTINVMGFIATKRFTIWLGTGVMAAASCVYDTVAGTYTFNALTTANVAVSVTQGTKTASGTLVPGTPLILTVA